MLNSFNLSHDSINKVLDYFFHLRNHHFEIKFFAYLYYKNMTKICCQMFFVLIKQVKCVYLVFSKAFVKIVIAKNKLTI